MAKPAKPAKKNPENAALERQALAMATAPDPQSGMAMVSQNQPSLKAVKAAQKAAVDEQFQAAAEKGAPNAEQLAAIKAGMAVRGF